MSRQWGSAAARANGNARAVSGGGGGRSTFRAAARRSSDRVSTRTTWGFGKAKTPDQIARDAFGRKK